MWGRGTYFLEGERLHDMIHRARKHASSHGAWSSWSLGEVRIFFLVPEFMRGYLERKQASFAISGFFGEG